MTDAILRRREAKPDEPLTESDVRDAACQVARPIFFSTAIIITTYLPLFAFQRDRGQAVLSDGLCGRLRAARRAGVRASGGAGPGLRGVSPAAPRLPQLRCSPGSSGTIATPWPARCAARPSPICWRRRGHCRGAPRRHGVARIPAGSRRRRDLAARASCRREFRCRKPPTWSPTCGASSNSFPEVSSVVSHTGRNDDGTDPWTPLHMEAAVILHAVRHLAGRRDQARADRAHGGEARPIAGLRDRIQPADHGQRARLRVRSAQLARRQGVRRRFQRVATYRQRHRRRLDRRSRRHRCRDRSNTRRCRKSRSRSIARRRRATASTSPTSSI